MSKEHLLYTTSNKAYDVSQEFGARLQILINGVSDRRKKKAGKAQTEKKKRTERENLEDHLHRQLMGEPGGED